MNEEQTIANAMSVGDAAKICAPQGGDSAEVAAARKTVADALTPYVHALSELRNALRKR